MGTPTLGVNTIPVGIGSAYIAGLGSGLGEGMASPTLSYTIPHDARHMVHMIHIPLLLRVEYGSKDLQTLWPADEDEQYALVYAWWEWRQPNVYMGG